jgi:hypothetical protein
MEALHGHSKIVIANFSDFLYNIFCSELCLPPLPLKGIWGRYFIKSIEGGKDYAKGSN